MSIAMRGLKLKPNYGGLINVAVSDKLCNTEITNREASFLRNGYVMSQLDGEGMRTMERQHEMASKEAYKELLLKESAKNTGANAHGLRNDSHQELRTDRVNQALNPNTQFYNLARSDQDMEPLHSLPPSEETEIRDDMSTRTIPRSVNVANQSSAVADYTNEIERQRQIAENERLQQELRHNHQLETVRQEAASVLQPTTQTLTEQIVQKVQQVIAEAEEQHNRKQ